jgi:hypothetical protein
MPPRKFIGTCPQCGMQYGRNKRVTGWCSACSVRKTQENRLIWKRVSGE